MSIDPQKISPEVMLLLKDCMTASPNEYREKMKKIAELVGVKLEGDLQDNEIKVVQNHLVDGVLDLILEHKTKESE